MSEDADASDGEGWRHLQLNWGANDLTTFFRTLDTPTSCTRKDHVKEPTKRMSSASRGNVSQQMHLHGLLIKLITFALHLRIGLLDGEFEHVEVVEV